MNSDFKERAWSLLDTRPMLIYSKQADVYFVVWDGEVMTREEAIYAILVWRCGAHASKKIKIANLENYLRLYKSGILEKYTDELKLGWGILNMRLSDTDLSQKMALATDRAKHVTNCLSKAIVTKNENKTYQEMLEWFNYDKAIEDD